MKNDGGPAFPAPPHFTVDSNDALKPMGEEHGYFRPGGMSLREYAAIRLRIPESGEDWLDEMIRKAMRDEFAGMVVGSYFQIFPSGRPTTAAAFAYEVAGRMLEERKKKEEADG